MTQESDLISRMTEVETQLTHQQHLCDQLNKIVTEHTQQLMRLERLMVRLEGQLQEFSERAKDAATLPQERPPHY